MFILPWSSSLDRRATRMASFSSITTFVRRRRWASVCGLDFLYDFVRETILFFFKGQSGNLWQWNESLKWISTAVPFSRWLLPFSSYSFLFHFVFTFYLIFPLPSLSPVPTRLRQRGHHPGSCAKWLQTHFCHLHSWAYQTEVANQISSSHRAGDARLGMYGYDTAFLKETLFIPIVYCVIC